MRKRSMIRAMHEVVSGGRCSGKTKGKIGCHGCKVESEQRLRSWDGREQAVLRWQTAITYVGLATGP